MAKHEAEYWCHPQRGGHAALYFRGHDPISREEYIEAVGPGDCDPHIGHGRRRDMRKPAKKEKRLARKAR